MSKEHLSRSVTGEANELDLARAKQERVAGDLTRLIDTATAPIIGIDARGRVNEWNQTAVRMTGFSKAEAVGKDFVDAFITNDVKESVREVLDKALLGEETSNYEFPLFAKSGERVDILLNSTTRRDAQGRATGVICIGQNIAEQRPPGEGPVAPKWHRLYFALAGFDVLTVCLGLFLTVSLLALFNQSLSVNQKWTDRLALYSEIHSQAQSVNAPGNNIFYSEDVPLESALLSKSMAVFQRLSLQAREDLEANVEPTLAGSILEDLKTIDLSMAAMVADARQVLELFELGRRAEAAGRMALMDQNYARVNHSLEAVNAKVLEVQSGLLAAQFLQAERLERYGYVIAGLVFFMVLGVAGYGSKVQGALSKAFAESQRFASELEAAYAEATESVRVAKAALVHSDDLAALIDTANAPIFGIDANGQINEWNQKSADITGFLKAEVMGHPLVDEFITDDFKSSVQEVLDKALQGEQTANYQFALWTKDSARVDVLLNASSRRDAEGKIIGVVGVGQNITELTLLRAEQERVADDLTRLIDTANAPIIGIDARGRVNEWNQTAVRMTGFSKTEAVGKDLVEGFITNEFKDSVREVLEKALLGEETSNYEFPLFAKSGERVDILLNSTTRRDAESRVIGVVGVGQNITELTLVRAEQERVADDLTRLIDTANAPIIGIDARGRVNEWNQTAVRMTGFSKTEAVGKDLVEGFITNEFKDSVREVLDKALLGEETSNYEFPLFTKSGERVDILLNSTTRRDAESRVIGVVGVGQNITELTLLRAEQARVADDLTRLIDTANAPIIGIDARGRVNEWNQTAVRMTGFSKTEAVGKDLVEGFITNEFKDSVREVLEKALLGEETSNYEFPLFAKSGERVDILLNSTTRRDAESRVIGVVGVGQNITELTLVRAEQERVADDLTRLIDTANAPIIGIDARGRVNEWNQTAVRMTGFSKTEAVGKDLVEGFITNEFKDSVREVLEKALLGEETSNYEFPLFAKSGERVDILLNSTTRRDAESRVIGVVGVGQNITELTLVRAEQARVADDLTRLIDTANAPIIGIDARGRVNEWNQTAVRMTGFSKTEAVGKDLVEGFITNEFKDSVREVLEKALLGEETSNYEFPLFAKSGERIHLLLNATSRRAKDQTILGVIGIGQDISGRLEEEENLRHRERLEAVGSLTGGIAHDFNNLLTVVTGNLSMLGPRAGEEQEILDDAIKAARDGSNLVRDLLAFSRRQSLVPETCSMDAVLKHFQRSLGRALGEAITLEVSIEEAGLAAFVDKARFEAALLNVCINARDAVKTNGRITLKVFSSSPNHGDAPLIRKIQGSNNDSVCVQISDNGSGIEPELLSKITDPYFTTKDIGKGSGLGLSSVVGFVDQSGGSFRIFSTVGFGTTVEIFLPRSSQALIAEQSRTSTHAVDSDTGKEKTTIMVVDDEPNVLRLASRWLNRAGYNVIEAKNGDEALASIELRNGDIDVLFSDIVMPGKLNGWALAEEVSDRYPGIGIQLATGYDQVSQQEKGRVTKKRFPVLSKPYSLTDLSDSVRRLVSEKPRRARPSAVAATNTIPGS